MSKKRSFWYWLLAALTVATVYNYPQVAADLQPFGVPAGPADPLADPRPGVLGIAIVALLRAIPATIIAGIMIYILIFTENGRRIGAAVGQMVGMLFLIAIALGIIVSSIGPGSCSSDPTREYRGR